MEYEKESIVAVKKHSRLAKVVYFSCVILIALGILLLLVQLFSRSSKIEEIDMTANSSEMIAPQYKGKTSEDNEYLIVSKKATEMEDGVVLLSSPVANLFDNEKANNFVLDSVSGLYDDNKKILSLINEVEIEDEEGNKFKTKEIKVDLEKNIIYSENKIDLEGKIGKIEASKGLEIKDDGNTIIFKGKSSLIINDSEKSK